MGYEAQPVANGRYVAFFLRNERTGAFPKASPVSAHRQNTLRNEIRVCLRSSWLVSQSTRLETFHSLRNCGDEFWPAEKESA
jgi:hypothetical protein